MCIACEQEAMWFAYLRRRGLITPDGHLLEEPPVPGFVVEPVETQEENKDRVAAAADKAGEDQAVDTAESKIPQTDGRSE